MSVLRKIIDNYFPIVFLYGLSAYFLMDTKDFTHDSLLYPKNLAIVLIVLNTILLGLTILKRVPLPKIDENKVPKKFVIIFLSSVLYVAAVKYAGFVISSLIYCLLAAIMLGYEKKWKAFLVATLLVGAIYVGFRVILKVPLPTANFLGLRI